MASSIWGGLAGLGDAMVSIGQDMSKRAFADKLEREREARAAQREIDRENRQEAKVLKTPTTTEFFERDGALFARSLNKYGDSLDERLASKDEIDKRNRDRVKFDQESQARDISLDKALWEQGNRDEDRQMKQRLLEAQIRAAEALGTQRDASAAYSEYRAAGGGARGSRGGLDSALSDEMPSFGKTVNQLIADNKSIIEGYDLANEDTTELARLALDAALRGNKDPHDTFQRLLKIRADKASAASKNK